MTSVTLSSLSNVLRLPGCHRIEYLLSLSCSAVILTDTLLRNMRKTFFYGLKKIRLIVCHSFLFSLFILVLIIFPSSPLCQCFSRKNDFFVQSIRDFAPVFIHYSQKRFSKNTKEDQAAFCRPLSCPKRFPIPFQSGGFFFVHACL